MVEIIIKEHLKKALKKAYGIEVEDVFVEHPDNPEFGDYASNIAMSLAKTLKQSPLEIAKNLTYELNVKEITFPVGQNELHVFKSVEFLPPGFINFTLSDEWLHNVLGKVLMEDESYGSGENLLEKRIILEYTDPNPFKVFHIGHLMTNCIGESLSRIFEFQGAYVKRSNYQGDVGMHVAKSIWGIIRLIEEEDNSIEKLSNMPLKSRIELLGKGYALGARQYKQNDTAIEEMKTLNVLLYMAAQEFNSKEGKWEINVDYKKLLNNKDTKFDYEFIKELYFVGRKWSLEYFETLYKRLGTKFDYYYYESSVAEYGYKYVQEGLKAGIFEESDGALIFKGEKYGLHTRVFLNSMGLPVYEAKDLGLAFLKKQDYNYDESYIITANEIDEYFKVVLKAMSLLDADLARKTHHLSHGMMKLSSGKMSSRTGNVISGDGLLNEIKDLVQKKMKESEINYSDEEFEDIADKIAVCSIKYSVLKVGVGSDITFDAEKSLSLTGDTGPYIQYTYARIMSLLKGQDLKEYSIEGLTATKLESSILRLFPKFPHICALACEKVSPNLIQEYVLELCQNFNSLYSQLPILKEDNQSIRNFRLHLCASTARVIRTSLSLLGIEVVDKM